MSSVQKILIIVAFCWLIIVTFVLGRRWESNEVRLQLKENGVAESKYGDNDWFKVTGTVEEFER